MWVSLYHSAWSASSQTPTAPKYRFVHLGVEMSGYSASIPFGNFHVRRTAAPASAVAPERAAAAEDVPAPAEGEVTDPYAPLVEAAKAGNRYAADDLLAALRPVIVRYCRARIGRAMSTFSSADDVAQEVCLAVLTALPSYRSSGASFLGFVYGIATHKIMDFHRKYSRDKSLPVSDVPDIGIETSGPEQQLLRAELGQQLAELLNTLSDTQREVLTLRLVVGLSVAETADAISVTPGAVRVCQHRALTKLRNRLTARVGSPASGTSRTLTLD
ncbi:hypothetical protein GCM10025762_10180 [Haloechinothrix salitolerans]